MGMKLCCCCRSSGPQTGLHLFPVLTLLLKLHVQGIIQLAQLIDPKSINTGLLLTGVADFRLMARAFL